MLLTRDSVIPTSEVAKENKTVRFVISSRTKEEKRKRITSKTGADASYSIVVDKESGESFQIWEVLQLHYFIVRNINGVILVL
jgi:hypothetical protein